MNITKEEFAKIVEDLMKKYNKSQLKFLIKDFSDVLMFLSLYAGRNEIRVSYREIEKQKITVYFIESYDKTTTFEFCSGEEYLSFERKTENNNLYYFSKYEFDKLGNFRRTAFQKSFPIGIELNLTEKSFGTLKDGVYLSETKEKTNDMNVKIFKLKGDKKEQIFYSYKAKPDHFFMCRTSPSFQRVPVIELNGMTELADILSHQFDKDVMLLNDEAFFNHLIETSKAYYKIRPIKK